jgi:hypothetical protein
MKQYFQPLLILVAMQMKNLFDLNFLNQTASFIRTSVFFLLRLISTFLIFYGIFYLASFLKIFHNSPFLPTGLITTILTMVMVMSTISATTGLMKSFFIASENKVLLTFPIFPTHIFFSKIIVYYLIELKKTITFLLPMLLALGTLSPVSGFFYVWVFPAMLIVSFFPVLIGAILSVPVQALFIYFARFPWLKYTLLFAILGTSIYIIVQLIDLIPTNINILYYWGPIKSLFTSITLYVEETFQVVGLLVTLVFGQYTNLMEFRYDTGNFYQVLLGAFAGISLFIFIGYGLAKWLFLYLEGQADAITPISKPTRTFRPTNLLYLAVFMNEIKLAFRSKNFIVKFLLPYLAMPIYILLINQIFSAMNLYAAGKMVVQVFNLFILVLFYASMNAELANFFTSEGAMTTLNRTHPLNTVRFILTKVSLYLLISLISLGFAFIIFQEFMNYTFFNFLLVFLSIVALITAHFLHTILIDLLRIDVATRTQTYSYQRNIKESQSVTVAFIMALITFIATLGWLLEENILPDVALTPAFFKLMVIALLILGWQMYLFQAKINAYYTEKVT